MTVMAARGKEALGAFRETARTPNLRRAQLAFGTENAAEWAVTVALGILAYRDGGATAVGLVAMVRMLIAALAAPMTAVTADRFRRERVLTAVGVARALTLGLAAATVAADMSPLFAYALAVLATVAHTVFRPAHTALLPSLCTTPIQLTSTNVVRSMLASLSALLGPIAAAALVGPIGVEGVLAVAAAVSAWSALLALLVRYEAPPRLAPARPPEGALREVIAGLRVMQATPAVLLVAGLTAGQTFTRGCFSVLAVVLALQFLETGEAGVGILTAAFGAGAVAGSLLASGLVGSSGFGRWLGIGVVLWCLPFALIGVLPANQGIALAALAVVGVGNAVVDVAAFTVLQRVVPDEAMGRAFAAVESLLTLAVALGAVVTPLLLSLSGLRATLVVVGVLAPLGVAAAWPRLRGLDVRLGFTRRVVDLLRRVVFLRPLPIATLERLATEVSGVSVAQGALLIEEGEKSDDVYVIGMGRAEAFTTDRSLRVMGPGDCFGEIAALGRRRRTCSVRAETDLKLLRLRGEHVVAAVFGYSTSRSEAGVVVREQIGHHPEDPLLVALAADRRTGGPR